MTVDLVAALVAQLKADAGVAALVGTRVYGLELPAAEAAAMPRKAVVLQAAGGPSLTAGSYAAHDTQRIDAVAYGETPYEAERVRRAVHAGLKPLGRVVSAGVLLHWIEPAGGLIAARDPDLDWPMSVQSYQAFAAEEAA